MVNKLPELSIFFPFWNEEANIESVVSRAIPIANEIAEKWEILMVDDGSTDNTYKIAQKLAMQDAHLFAFTHKPNRGYGAALHAGFSNARYKYIVFTDGDGQFDFSEVVKFVEKIHSSDLVIGFREKRRDRNLLKRLLLMNLLKVGDFIFFGFHFKDIDCGFKMFKKSAVDVFMPLRSEGAMVTTEILAKAKKKKLKISEVGVTHYPRAFGDQSGANFPVVVRAILESILLWWDIKNGRF